MRTPAGETLLVLLLTIQLFGLWIELGRFGNHVAAQKASQGGPRQLWPRTPDD